METDTQETAAPKRRHNHDPRDVALPASAERYRIISSRQAASFWGVSIAQWRRLYQAKQVPAPIQTGTRKYGWRVGDLIDALDARRVTWWANHRTLQKFSEALCFAPAEEMRASFSRWLAGARITDDPVGDLIGDMKVDGRLPKAFASCDELRSYFSLRGACAAALRQASPAWRRYQRVAEAMPIDPYDWDAVFDALAPIFLLGVSISAEIWPGISTENWPGLMMVLRSGVRQVRW
jgi:hypothetical protein